MTEISCRHTAVKSSFCRQIDSIIMSLYGGAGMTTETAKFTLRIDTELLKKFRFVADYNARSANRELEVLMKKHIAEFEKENGKITFD